MYRNEIVINMFNIISKYKNTTKYTDALDEFTTIYKIPSLERCTQGKDFEKLTLHERGYVIIIQELFNNIVDEDEMSFINTFDRYCKQYYYKQKKIFEKIESTILKGYINMLLAEFEKNEEK